MHASDKVTRVGSGEGETMHAADKVTTVGLGEGESLEN